MTELSPVSRFDDWYAKREDLACWERPDWPSGAKVRQYDEMIKCADGAFIVGCSAWSAMQIYVAAAGQKYNRQAIIYVPGRKVRTDATNYAADLGAEIHEIRPCRGPNVYRARAREHARALAVPPVHWNPLLALLDTVEQTANIPMDVQRVLVPTGSGLTAAGVLAGLVGRDIEVVAVACSPMAKEDVIRNTALRLVDFGQQLPRFRIERLQAKYHEFTVAALPDGTPLDPFYAAKVVDFIRPADCLWLTGLRPVCAMPQAARDRFQEWRIYERA